MGQALSIGAAIIDPISYGIGYAAEAIDPSGWFSAFNEVGLNMFGKAGVAEAADKDVGEALLKGAGTDIRRTVNVFSGPVGWGAEAVSTGADFAGHENVGMLDPTTAGYISLGASAGAGAWNMGSSLFSSGASVSAEVANEAAHTGTTLAESAATTNSVMSRELASLGFGPNATVTPEQVGIATYALPGDGAVAGAGAGGAGFFKELGSSMPTMLKVGSAGLSIANGFLGAQSAVESAEAERRDAESKAEQAEIKADIFDAQQVAETNAAAAEKEQIAKRRRQLVGKGKTAAAANGVMLETRAESSPAMFEQDAAAEAAYEQGKVDYNMRMKNYTHGANAALSRMSAANYRLQGRNAKRLGNLKSTSSWISGLAQGGLSLVSAFA